MPELPPIRQRIEIKVDVDETRRFNRQIGETTEELEGLEAQTDRVSVSMGRLAPKIQQSEKNQRSYARATLLARKETQEFADGTEKVADGMEDVAQAAGRGGRAMVAYGAGTRRAKRDTDGLNKGLKDLRSSFRTAGALGTTFLAVLALKVPLVVAGLNLAVQAVFSLTAGMVALARSLGPVLNLAGLLPAVIGAAVGGMGALLIAAKPVGEAIGAALDPKTFAGTGETARDRARRLADAIRDVERAQESLSDATRDQERAQLDANDAYREAVDNLRDLREEQDRNSISVSRAEIALGRARENQMKILADSSTSEADRLEAVLDVQDAELDLKDAQQRRVDSARELNEAERQGVEGSDRVRDANEQLSDSVQAVADAQIALTRAMEDQATPQQQASSAATAFADAMKELSPSAQGFVNDIKAAQPLFKSIRRDVQEALFSPLREGFRSILGNANPFRTFLTESAAAIGDVGKDVGGFLGSKGFGRDLETLGKQGGDIIRALSGPLQSLLRIFTDLAVVGGPFVKEIIDLAGGGLQKFADRISALRSSGGLADIFRRGLDRAKEFGRIIRDTFVGLANVFRASTGLADDLVGSMERGAATFRAWTESTRGQNRLKAFFDDARAPLHEFWLLLKDVFALFGEIAQQNTLAGFISDLRTRILPILGDIVKSVGGKDFLDRILDLTEAFGNLFKTLTGLTGPFSALISAFTFLFRALDQVFQRLPFLKTLLGLVVGIGAAVKVLSLVTRPFTGLIGAFDTLFSKANRVKTAISQIKIDRAVAQFGITPLNVPTVGPTSPVGKAPAGKLGAAAAGGLGGLAASIGPQIAITAALTGVTLLATSAFEKWQRRKEQLKQITENFTDTLKDETASVEDAAAAAAQGLLGDRNQIDDLQEVGLSVEAFSGFIAEGADGLKELRERLIETGAIEFVLKPGAARGVLDMEEATRRANEEFIRTGEVARFATSNNNGLVQSIEDLAVQMEKAAENVLKTKRAEGDLTTATEDNLRAQLALEGGIRTILNPTLVSNVELLDAVVEAEQRAREEAEKRQQAADRIAGAAGSSLDAEIDLARAKDDAVESGRRLNKATLDLAKAQFKANPEEIAEAQNEYNDALRTHENDVRAARDAGARYYQSQVDIGEITADNTTKFNAQEAALNDIERRLGQDIDTSFIDRVQEDLNKTEFNARVALTPELLPMPGGLEGQSPEGQATRAARAVQGVLGPIAGVFNLLGGGKTLEVASQNMNVTAQNVTVGAKPAPTSTASRQSAPNRVVQTGSRFGAKGLVMAATGISFVGPGFVTNGPKAIVGEGKRQFPEFVIPTDPAYRENALRLTRDLVAALGLWPMMARGGRLDMLHDAINRPIVVMGQERSGSSTQIARQVGTEQNFSGANFWVRDFDDFRDQMERERRKANLAGVTSGRSPRL